MVVDHSFWVSCSARGVVERYRLPLVGGQGPGKCRITRLEKILITHLPQQLALRGQWIIDVDHHGLALHAPQRLADDAGELLVSQQDPGLAMIENESDRFRIEADVKRVQHRTRHGYAEVGLVQRRHVRCHDGNGVPWTDAALGERRRQAPAARIGLQPGESLIAMDHRRVIRIDSGRPFDEA